MSGHVIALGTFDGLHKGHSAVLNAALNFKNLIPVAVTFSEPPKRKTLGTFVPMLLNSDRKNEMLTELGFAEIFVLDYDEVHDIGPVEFLDILFEKYEVKAIVCGFNYRFGKGGQGDAALMSHYCSDHGAEAVVVPATTVSGQTVSSSLIRELIANGNISFANALLGRPFSFESEVIHGEERGRTMGFPTINQYLSKHLVQPRAGVYAARVRIGADSYRGLTNIGDNPTIGSDSFRSETYVFDFDKDVYGQTARIELLRFIRAEMKFESIDALRAQVLEDIERAKEDV